MYRVWEGACTAASVPWNQAEGPMHQNLRAAVHSHPRCSYLTSAQRAQKQPNGQGLWHEGCPAGHPRGCPDGQRAASSRSESRIPGAVNPGPIVCVCGASVSPSITAQEEEVRGTERKHPKPNLTGHDERTGSLKGVMVTASARPPALSFSHCEAIQPL